MDNTTNSLIQQLQQQNQTSAANDLTIPGNASSLMSQAQNALNAGSSNNGPVAGAPVTTNNTGGGLLGTLARWAPTIGSVALPAIADIATGGLAAPLDVALAAAGGAGGRMAENAASGQKVLSGNDITAGLEAGVGQGIGKGLNIGLNAAGGALTKFGASAGEKATAQATADAADKAYSAIPKGLREAYNMNGSKDLAQSVGIDANNPADMSKQAWGANNAVNSRLNTALGDQSINTSDLQKLNDALNAKVVLGPSGSTATIKGLSPEAQTVVDAFDKAGYENPATKTYIDQLGNISSRLLDSSGATNAQTFRQATQEVGDLFGSSIPKVASSTGATDPVQAAASSALNRLYNYMDDTTFGSNGVASAVKNIEPSITAEEIGGSQGLADMGNTAIQSGDPQQIKDFLHQTGNMGKIGQEAVDAGKGVVTKQASGGGVKSMFNPRNLMEGGGILEAVKGHPAVGIPLMIAGNPAAAGATGGLLSKLATGRIGQTVAPAITTALATSPNTVQGGNIVNPSQSGNIQAGSSVLDQALQEAMGNPLNGGLSQISALLPMVQKVNAAQAAEQNIAQYFNAAGGAQGPIGGIINKLLSGFGTGGAAAQYGAQSQALEQQLQAAGINAPAPQITQNKTAAQAAINNIQNLIQSLQLGNQSGVLTQ